MDKQPIRVAHIIGKWVGGGVEAVVMNYYRHINREKIQFDFFCDEDSTNIPYDEIKKLGGKVILIPPYQKVIKYNRELKKKLKEGNYKIVHSHINTLSVFPLLAAKQAGVEVRIAHSHSTTNKIEWKKNLIKQFLKIFSKLFATDYFACTEHAGRWMFGNKLFDKGYVYILNNAIDLDKFKYNEKIRLDKRRELEIDKDTLVIGHVGRFVKQKNHDFLIDVFNEIYKKNRKSVLLLVGQGPLIDEIRAKVNRLGLTDNVKFLGQRNDINELYQAFDIFLLPSLYEGLGMVLIEAQVSGLPCICSTEIPSIAKVTSNLEFIDLSSGIDKWNKKITQLLKSCDRKNNLDKFNITCYDIKKEAKKLEDKYLNYIKNNEKVNVCHVVCGLKSGGVETMIYNYCSNITPEKYDWHLLYQHDPSLKNLREFEKIGFKLQRIASKKQRPIKNYIDTYKYFKENKINIVHCHMTLMNFIPLIAAKKAKIQIRICHSHNSDVRKKNIIIKMLENILKKICIKNATHLVACGEDAGRYMYNNKEYHILYNAMNLDKYKFNEQIREKIRKKYKISPEKYVIGHIGRFTEQKNHSFIIDLFKQLSEKDESLILFLVGDGELKETIIKKVENYNLKEKVIFTGIVSNTNELYSAFDLFILPSLWEGLPVSAIEAQASGLNLIISNNIDNETIINSKKCTKVDLNIKEWEKEIHKKRVKHNDRMIEIELFRNKKLDITKEVVELEKIYDERLIK